MSFTEKILAFAFSGAVSGDFIASGLRAVVSIEGSYGRLGTNGVVKIWGLSLKQMNAYSTRLPAAIGGNGISSVTLAISAGDSGGLSEVINAKIWQSYIDLTGAPDSAFVVTVSGAYDAANPMGAQSPPPKVPGTPSVQNAEDLIASICAGAGYTLTNINKAHAVLRNQSTYGSALDQIERIAQAAGFAWSWSGTKFFIWPATGTVDNTVVQLGPDFGMVGYPQYYPTGIIVTSLFNPEIKLGRPAEVIGSGLIKANGPWQIVGVQHDLSTMLSKGPWFTTAKLATSP